MATIVIKDKNLVPENIKKGVTILKVTGTLEGGGSEPVLQEKTVNSSTVSQDVTPSQGYDGLSKVTVNPYTLEDKTVSVSPMTQVIRATNASALNEVTVNGALLQNKTVDPSTSQIAVSKDEQSWRHWYGLGTVTVNAVTSSIDGNIQAGNIKKDVTILGVTGTYESTPVQPVLQDVSVSYSQNGSYTLEASSGYDGLGTVDIDVSVASQGGNDWLVDTLAGNITDLSGYSLPAPTHDYQYYFLFSDTSITNIPDMSTWTSISGTSRCSYMFKNCTGLTTVSLPNITTVYDGNLSNMFNGCTNLTTVDLSGLATYTGSYSGSWFNGCTSLESVDLSSFNSVSGSNPFYGGIFRNCPSLKTLKVGAKPITQSDFLSEAYSIENLEVTTTATNSVQLNDLRNLTADSVLSVLAHLGYPWGTCTFYLGGLTVTDYQDGRIQTAYDAATTAGWTISNLTIVQPEPEPEPEPESQPCPACGGTGIDPETGETCSTCDGSGVIS